MLRVVGDRSCGVTRGGAAAASREGGQGSEGAGGVRCGTGSSSVGDVWGGAHAASLFPGGGDGHVNRWGWTEGGRAEHDAKKMEESERASEREREGGRGSEERLEGRYCGSGKGAETIKCSRKLFFFLSQLSDFL